MVFTGRFPRTAQWLQLGRRVESESVALARIHILQLLDDPVVVWCLLQVPTGKVAVWQAAVCEVEAVGGAGSGRGQC